MASTFTANVNLEEPARGDDIGTWDTPVNNNTTVADLIFGGVATIALNNTPVVLAAAQFRSNMITFNSTLTGSVTITFPTSFIKPYSVQHLCTGSSAFVITLTTTAAGGQAICVPPGTITDIYNDGTNLKFRNLERVGTYWDYGGSSVPAWVSGCTKQPYLNCDGTTFSAATYPQLAVILGSTTLPDSKGRVRAAMNQGTTRLTSAIAGVDGNTRGAAGGDQSMQSHNHGITDPGHLHTYTNANSLQGLAVGVSGSSGFGAGAHVGQTLDNINVQILSNTTGITINSNGAGASQNVQPTYIGGIVMIRAE